MPRRRMLDPSFFEDTDVAKLSRDERLFLLGCVRNADDEGRLKGHCAYLKAEIFMYDEDISLEGMGKIKESTLEKIKQWPESNPWRLLRYRNSSHEYLCFPLWFQHQAPSHPQPSQLPPPPAARSLGEPLTEQVRKQIYERDNYTCQYCGADLSGNPRTLSIDHIIPLIQGGTHHRNNLVTACKSCNLKKRNRSPEEAGMSLIPGCKVNSEVNDKVSPKVSDKVNHTDNSMQTQDRSGQSSQGKVSIVQVSAIQEDFKKFSNSESDLTDFLMKTMTKYVSAAAERAGMNGGGLGGGSPGEPVQERETFLRAQWGIMVIEQFWKQVVGRFPSGLWQGGYEALKKYPVEVVARAFVRAGRYEGGKHKSWKYVQAIIDEEMEKGQCQR